MYQRPTTTTSSIVQRLRRSHQDRIEIVDSKDEDVPNSKHKAKANYCDDLRDEPQIEPMAKRKVGK